MQTPISTTAASSSEAQTLEFSRSREKWREAGICNYGYTLNIVCFCGFYELMPLRIQVRNGEPVSITSANGAIDPTAGPDFELFSRYASFDRVFSELEADLAGRADEVTVTYDGTYGYPTHIYVDQIKRAIDDELDVTITDLDFE